MKKKTAMIVLLASVVVAAPFVWRAGAGTVRAEEEGSVKINEANFPDKIFRDYVKSSFDTDSNGELSAEELNKVQKINISLKPGAEQKVKNLKGVEFFTELRSLECDCNAVTSLDLSTNTKVEKLSCNYNKISKLNLKGCSSLKEVYCALNSLTQVDLSDCAELGFVDFSENLLTAIDISKCTKLTEIYVDACSSYYLRPEELGIWVNDGTNNPITKLDVSHNPDLAGISADETLLASMDVSMLHKLEWLSLDNLWSISSLKLGSHPNLERLIINFDNVRSLDLTGCPNIVEIAAYGNHLSNIDLSKNTKLESLDLGSSDLKTIDLSHCPKLNNLALDGNLLTSIDVSMLPELEYLDVSSNELTELDLRNNNKIVCVSVPSNKLTGLNFGNIDALENLDIRNNQVSSLDLSKAASLIYLETDETNLTELNLSSSTELEYLTCVNNKLTSLDLDHCTKLQWLECDHNALTELKVSNCSSMQEMNCSCNYLTELDLSCMKKLERLHVEENKGMTKLILPKNSALQSVNCNDMSLTELDASDQPNLKQLYCFANQLKSLNVKNDTSLELLCCTSNQITDLDLSGLHKLYEADCQSNKLQNLTLDCDGLLRLFIENNELTKLDFTKCESFFKHAKECGIEQSPDGKYYECADVEGEDDETLRLVFARFDLTVKEVSGLKLPELNQGFEAFVERLYTIALNRASDPEGKKYWVERVENNDATGADCARFFLLDAPEFAQRNLSNEDFLETLYKVFFNRESDKGGKEFYLGELKNGVTRAQIIDDFIESNEWCDLCTDFGIASGAKIPHGTKQRKKVEEFVTRLYRTCLLRETDEEGLHFWTVRLLNKQVSGIQAARFFFGSPEFKELEYTDDEFVERLYETFFNRSPDYDGLVFWKGQLEKGVSRDAIVDLFVTSKEFRQLCAVYGIEVGTL